jgi:hypothetical protein
MLHVLVSVNAIHVLPVIGTYKTSFRRVTATSYEAAMNPNEPICTVEAGFDYAGNEIASVPGSSYDGYWQCASARRLWREDVDRL